VTNASGYELSGRPTPPIAFAVPGAEITDHLHANRVELDDAFLARLGSVCAAVDTSDDARAEAGRDWWSLAMIWSLDDPGGRRAAASARPGDAAQVAAVVALCHEAGVPVTAAAGRSGVCGASVPVHGGVLLDLQGLSGIVGVDDTSLIVDVLPGTYGDWFEDRLRTEYGLTAGHWPQSMAISTVGGWIACRGAGQLSTRYGKIEDIVVGLDVVLADGTPIHTNGEPRRAVGPDLTQLFLGSEGTLGIITGARLRVHPAPPADRRAAYSFPSFAAGLDACRRILRRGATPAVLRLYDDIEGARQFETAAGVHPLLVLDEGDPALIDAVMAVVAEECADAQPLDPGLLNHWLENRNNVDALERNIRRGAVVDTMEISAPWAQCAPIYDAAIAAIMAVPGSAVASAHQSHSYTDGACLYFTFAGLVDAADRERYYVAAWDAGTRAVLEHGGALSHHHGIGLNRARFVPEALGAGFDVLVAMKHALDPKGILNPGKLGLPDPFGAVHWPS
jgi:alkyldihydroxyacetonephosphate synthase